MTRSRTTLLLVLALTVAALAGGSQALAWNSPQAFYTGAAREVFSVAGDPAGNAFAVIAGESLDKPLLLMERWATGDDAFLWSGAAPLPGGDRYFTNKFNTFDSFRTTGAGDGVGLIVWREVARDGGATLHAMTREPPLRFTEPAVIARADLSPRAGQAAAISASGDLMVAFRIGRGPATGRSAFVQRRSPGRFRAPRTLSSSPTGEPATAIGGDGTSVVAWTRGTRVELRRVSITGTPGPTERLGDSQAGGGVTAALSQKSAGVIAWQDDGGAIRAVRRAGPGKFAASRLVRSIAKTARVDGLTAAVDDRGLMFVAWRERTSTTRRVRVASATATGKFTMTQLSTGKTLGAPALTARPGGGALVAWRTTSGWKARTAPRTGIFTATVTVSRGLKGADLSVPRAAALAGPGARVDLIWPQTSEPPEPLGPQIFQSSETEEIVAPSG